MVKTKVQAKRSSFGKTKPKTAGVLRQKQKQRQSVVININTNKARGGGRARAQPNTKPSYLQTITTYPIFREASYEPLYRNTEPVREITAPFIDKTTPVMVNTPPIPQRVSETPSVNEVPLVASQEFETPSSKIMQKIREKSAARQKIFADKYEKKNRDSFEDRMTFADSFRRQNLDRAFDTLPTTPVAAQEFETPSVKLRRKSYEETSAKRRAFAESYERRNLDRTFANQPPTPTPIPVQRESLLPRPRGRPATVKADPIEEAKRLATNAAAREKRKAIKETLAAK